MNREFVGNTESEKREHHNELERKRRHKLKKMFGVLKETIIPPDEKISREKILLRAQKFIRAHTINQKEVDDEIKRLTHRNNELKKSIDELEKQYGHIIAVNKFSVDCYDLETESESEFDAYKSSDDPEWNINMN